jgi:PAS domain S-box-containing protein
LLSALISGCGGRGNTDGEIKEYSALFCEWLIGLFGIKFTVNHLSLLVLLLVVVLFFRSRLTGKELEKLVEKRAHELAFQTATLSALFDSIPDLIFTKDLNLKFLHCNKAFLEHFNKGINEITGNYDSKDMGMTEEEAHAYTDMDRKVIREKQPVTIEERIPRFDGTRPLYETIKMPLVLNDSVVGILGIARDITKRKEAEAAALAASRSKSSFLANMSHEIRTPMNAILGVTEILIQNEKIPKDIEEGLDKIHSSCDLLLGIINDILDFSKIEAGKIDIIPAQYKVASMINDSVHLNMMRTESKPVEFELLVNENVPAKLIGDELRIKQILNNLLSNAFKYTDTGKVILSVEVEAKPETAQPQQRSNQVTLVLSVQDTGQGMTNDQLDKLFEEYARFNQRSKNYVEGTGLGLAITHRLINLMGGQIHVKSEPDKGTLFTARLPQEIVDDETLGKDVTENLRQFRKNYMIHGQRGQIERDPMPYGKVLVVDDIETNIYIAAGLLKLYKLQIEIAMSGQEAIDKIKEGNIYDVLFMDHMMPEMDGLEAVKRIRGFGYAHPIIALTANAVTGQADMFLENGFDDFISKPIDIRQLDSVLNTFIRDKQSPEIIESARRQNETSVSEEAGVSKETGGDSNHEQINSFLIDSFIRDANKAAAWLDEALLKNEFEDNAVLQKFTVMIHGIKSALWNIQETETADLALLLETGGREHDINLIKKTAPEFLDKLRALLEKKEFKPGGNEASEDDDMEKLSGALNEIQRMAGDYDRKGILDIIAGVKNYSKETKAVLEIIAEHALHSEFDEAEKTAKEYAADLAKNEK